MSTDEVLISTEYIFSYRGQWSKKSQSCHQVYCLQCKCHSQTAETEGFEIYILI